MTFDKRKTSSWAVVAASVAMGMVVLGIACALWEWENRLAFYVIGLAGIVPVVASLLAIRNSRSAWKLDLIAAPVIIPFGLALYPTLRGIAIGAAICASLIPGIFWLVTSRRDWATPLSQRLLPGNHKAAILLIGIFLSGVAGSAALFSLSLPWWPLAGDCGYRSLLADDGETRGLDFTARILFVPPKLLALRFSGQTLWSVARIEERFSRINRVPNTVILRGVFRPNDESKKFFVEGRLHNRTHLSHFLPIVEPTWCGHTKPLEQAALELRIVTAPRPSREHESWVWSIKATVTTALQSLEQTC